MRFPVVAVLSVGCAGLWSPHPLRAQETTERSSMRQLISVMVKSRMPDFDHSPAEATAHDPDLVTLPPFLVNAPVLRVPTKEDTVRPVVPVVQPVDYNSFAVRDARRQENLHELLQLADLTQRSGDIEFSEKMRRETYRALFRDLTPLERAMDRSINAGRY